MPKLSANGIWLQCYRCILQRAINSLKAAVLPFQIKQERGAEEEKEARDGFCWRRNVINLAGLLSRTNGETGRVVCVSVCAHAPVCVRVAVELHLFVLLWFSIEGGMRLILVQVKDKEQGEVSASFSEFHQGGVASTDGRFSTTVLGFDSAVSNSHLDNVTDEGQVRVRGG